MKLFWSLSVTTLFCVVGVGCGFETYRPDQLYNSRPGISECAVTRLNGIVYENGRGVTLVQPGDKYNSITLATKNGYHILPKGGEVDLIDLSSQWDSLVGRFIMARAKVPSLGNKIYLFRIYYLLNRTPDKDDFKFFLEKGFASCRSD